jgi:hypothetical protein
MVSHFTTRHTLSTAALSPIYWVAAITPTPSGGYTKRAAC